MQQSCREVPLPWTLRLWADRFYHQTKPVYIPQLLLLFSFPSKRIQWRSCSAFFVQPFPTMHGKSFRFTAEPLAKHSTPICSKKGLSKAASTLAGLGGEYFAGHARTSWTTAAVREVISINVIIYKYSHLMPGRFDVSPDLFCSVSPRAPDRVFLIEGGQKAVVLEIDAVFDLKNWSKTSLWVQIWVS